MAALSATLISRNLVKHYSIVMFCRCCPLKDVSGDNFIIPGVFTTHPRGEVETSSGGGDSLPC